MAIITSAIRNNITQLLNRPVMSNKLAKSTSSEFASAIDNVGVENAAKEFIKLPSQTKRADTLFDEMACKGLPASIRNAILNEKGDAIRNMLGIIYENAEPKDEAVFQKVFDEVIKENNNFAKEKKLSSELSFLFSKYGQKALDKYVSEYTQQCREAWKHHNTGHDTTTTDEDIFMPDVMACYAILEQRIGRLSQPNQTWTSVYVSGVCFKNTCAALSKTLRPHGIQSSPEAPAGNTPNITPLVSEPHQPGVTNPMNPDISIPASNGHGPITIHNTANGGNGTSIVDGKGASTPASDIDFGIALLNTPNEQLGNEKARLVEKFMDLYWGRAQNGGQDKFSDHVDNVVQTNPPVITFTEILSSPPILQAVDEFVAIPAPQFASVIDSIPRPVIEQVSTIGAIYKMMQVEENVSLVPGEKSVPLGSIDAGKSLQNAATQVAQALSTLLTGADTAVSSQGTLQQKSSGLTTEEPSEPEQALQSIKTTQAGQINGAGSSSSVQQLIRKFEIMNNQHQVRNESVADRVSLRQAERTKGSSPAQASNADKTEFQPLKRTSTKFKFDVSKNQAPVYTTNRTIDPFSRHSADVKSLANSFNEKSEDEFNDLVLNSDLVSRL